MICYSSLSVYMVLLRIAGEVPVPPAGQAAVVRNKVTMNAPRSLENMILERRAKVVSLYSTVQKLYLDFQWITS